MSTKKDSNATIFRVHKTKNYTVMSNHHLFDKPPLSLKAKGLMSLILALPDDWNYSINGLCAICKEGRDGVKSALSELKEAGYVYIERTNAKGGKFNFTYHIFEQKREEPWGDFPSTVKPQTVAATAEEPSTVNQLQINTNNEILKKEILINESLENASVFDADSLFNLYKLICVSFPQPKELTDSRIKKANKRLKVKPTKEFWETICQKAEKSVFIKANTWFNFDWIVKNDENPLKVFEGNYDGKPQSKTPQAQYSNAPVGMNYPTAPKIEHKRDERTPKNDLETAITFVNNLWEQRNNPYIKQQLNKVIEIWGEEKLGINKLG